MFDRLTSSIKPFAPQTFIQLGDPYLRKLGVTRQKASYIIHLSASVVDGNLKLSQLKRMSDAEAKLNLMRIKGIGSWSADIYLLMAMRRADIWPAGDLALAIAVKDLKKLASRPGSEELEEISQNWRPHRAVAARMLWQFYLAKKIAR
jgi:DNA-3-methyladenine glycosylase II